ncbi:ferredoxin--NADP reductase [Sediminicola luteus]|uniref:Phenylacetic acid degradation protein n=1 Tax=Sediminicola luteus TaxID=319238 RepID=A0A2A4GAQ6_9FLAO|nr:ferredoxin--NADP reductase [Sediminicola luteus]PCE66039.1 hypothetical protein B7P33_01695 [Sediminicola luteus]
MSTFHSLKIIDKKDETAESVSLVFEIPTTLKSDFTYKAGQYLTLRFRIEGEDVRRSYSICSAPTNDGPMRIGVKRVKNGLVSNHISDTLQVGDQVEVMPPNGRFFVTPDQANYKTYYLFAAGSGITPILAILKTILHQETRSYVYLMYGNRDMKSAMFKTELDDLLEAYSDRFFMTHILSRSRSSWLDMLRKKDEDHRKGRIDTLSVKGFVNDYQPYAQDTEYYICGPGTMIENTKTALKEIDVPDSRIHFESFGDTTSEASGIGVSQAQLEAHLNGEKINVPMKEDQTILRALIEAGKEPPYSCEGGVCSTCVCKLESGKVHMKANMTLDEKEVAQGFILSCQSLPLTEKVVVRYKE